MKKNKIIINILLTIVLITTLSVNATATDIIENDNQNNIENEIQNPPEINPPEEDNNNNLDDETQNPDNNDGGESEDNTNTTPEQGDDGTTQEPEIIEPPTQTPQEPTGEQPSYNQPTNNEQQEKKSENANLRLLQIDIEGLEPEFDPSVTQYYLLVDLTVEGINITAVAEDSNARVSIYGNTDLQEGENTITITVEAEAGNTKTYIITVTKTDDAERANANIKTLSLKGFSVYPTFKSNIYNYNLTINEKISQFEIFVETVNENATYEIIGNQNLQEGDNIIKIIVTAEDGLTKREYKINAFISSKNVQLQEQSKAPAIIALGVIGALIIGIVVVLIKKK